MPRACSSRATQRQPVVASSATTVICPCHLAIHTTSAVREASKRSSVISPSAGLSTAAWKMAL
jgi:hypothetical protein